MRSTETATLRGSGEEHVRLRPPFAAKAHGMPELVIFDCDGVLVDTERVYNRAWAEVLPTLGLPWQAIDCARNLSGRTLPDCQSIVAEALGCSLPDDFLPRVLARTRHLFDTEGLQPVPGVAAVVEALERPKCVASSGTLSGVLSHLEHTDLLRHFHPHIFVGAMVPRSKPAPDLFLYAAEKMGARPWDCVVIEDSLAGVQGARAAGMRVLGYAADHFDSALLRQAGAELFHDMRELPALIDGKP